MANSEELIKQLDKLEDEGMTQTKEWSGVWETAIRYFFSDQLQGKRRHKDWDWVILNYIWPACVQEIAKLSKNPAKIIALPWEDSDSDAAEVWQNIGQYLWHKGINGTGMRLEQIAMLMDWKLYGISVSKWYWEPKNQWDINQKIWTGDVKYRLWHPAEFWSLGTEKIDEGPCGTVRYVDLEWAQARWPDKAKDLQEQAEKFSDDMDSPAGRHIRGQYASSFSTTGGRGYPDKGPDASNEDEYTELLIRYTRNPSVKEKQTSQKSDKKLVKISEFYFRDYTERKQKNEQPIPAEELLASGEIYAQDNVFKDKTGQDLMPDKWPTRTIAEWDEPLYPLGRHIIKSGDVVLNDGKGEDVWTYKKWPFVVSPHYLLSHTWRGVDGVSLYKNTQDLINVSTTHLLQNMKLHGDPKVWVERGAIDSPPDRQKEHFRIGAGAGYIVRLKRGGLNKIKEVPPPPPSAAAMMLYGVFSQEFKNLLGMQDIAMGKSGKRVTATEAKYLAISSNDRIALQSVMLDEWIRKSASMMLEIAQQNYDIGRYVRIFGEENQAGIVQISQGLKDIGFDVDIVPSATLPFDEEKRLAKFERAYALFAQPVANPMMPQMLRELEIPNAKKLLAQFEPYQQYLMLLQLYQGVKEGKILPRDAANAIIQKLMQVYMQEKSQEVPMRGPEMMKGKENGKPAETGKR